MTRDLETIGPLVIGAIVSLVTHLVVFPEMVDWILSDDRTSSRAKSNAPDIADVLPQPEIKIGADVPDIPTVAWISHEDFQSLIAPKSETQQPGVQQEIDPVTLAPIPPTAQPGSPSQTTSQQPFQINKITPPGTPGTPDTPEPPITNGTQDPVDAPTSPPQTIDASDSIPPSLRPNSTPPPATDVNIPGTLISDQKQLHDLVTASATPDHQVHKQPDATRSPPSPDFPPDLPPAPSSDRATGKAPEQSDPITPTPQSSKSPGSPAAPRSDKDSDPATFNESPLDVRLGGVITGEGIEIKPVRPVFSISSRYTALPENPIVEVVFDRTGKVTEARLIKSTGYPDIDAPLEASLYKWKASGPRLEQSDRPLGIRIRIIGFE